MTVLGEGEGVLVTFRRGCGVPLVGVVCSPVVHETRTTTLGHLKPMLVVQP